MRLVLFVFLFCGFQSISSQIVLDDILELQNKNFTKSVITTLASDEFDGRSIDRPTINRSILFIESLFRAFHIKTYFNSYRIPYKITDSAYAYNLLGYYRGHYRKRNAILITANYDNLGISKLDKGGDSVYNGANDNATGVAAVFQLALFFYKVRPKANVIFAFTSGKHQNMLGAGFLADTIQKHGFLDIDYVINLEMLGKHMIGNNNNLLAITDSANNLVEVMNSYIDPDFIGIAKGSQYEETSENTPFYNVLKIPSTTLTSFSFNNDEHYLNLKDDYDNIDLEYLHRTIGRITQALYSMVLDNRKVIFLEEEKKENKEEETTIYDSFDSKYDFE